LRISRKGLLFSAVPSVLAVSSFYSLCLHMRLALGGWPTMIGTQGFPPGLTVHADMTFVFVYGVFILSFFILPLAIFVCLLAANLRRFVPYLLISLALLLLGDGLIQLAPEPFLIWWLD
jgi:hypothetical protein